MGYCPFSSMSHDTMDCIVTKGAEACSRGATIWPRGLATRPYDTASKGRYMAGLRIGQAARASRCPGHGVSRNTKFVSWLGETVWCCDTAQQGCDTTL